MSIKRHQEQTQAKEQKNRIKAAEDLHQALIPCVGFAHEGDAFSRLTPDTFYHDRDPGTEGVRGHKQTARLQIYETRLALLIQDQQARKSLTVEERTHDDPALGEAVTSWALLGDELLIDRRSQGLEGPFGVILFLSPDKDMVTDFQAKCFEDGQTQTAPAQVIFDLAQKLHQAYLDGLIEPERPFGDGLVDY